MSEVGIVTDSTICLPAELIEEYNIGVVPVELVIDGKAYRDRIDISAAEFYRIYPTLKEMPTTNAVTPGAFLEAFENLAKSTDCIACVVVSKELSATIEAAEQARQMIQSERPELKIEIIDSRLSAGALGLIVLEAARAAREGKSLAEVVEVVQGLMPRAKYIGAFDTLKYLIKGGRAPKTAVIGELLQMKPLVGLVNNTGLVESLGKVRTKQKSLAKIVELAKQYVDSEGPVHVIVHYTHSIKDGEVLKEMVTSQLNCQEVYLAELTPVMCCHTGPVTGLAFYS